MVRAPAGSNRYAGTMDHTRPSACLSLALLRHVRDAKPNESQLACWLAPGNAGAMHVLRKAGLLILVDGTVTLSPAHLSADGTSFRYEDRLFLLDEERELIVRR